MHRNTNFERNLFLTMSMPVSTGFDTFYSATAERGNSWHGSGAFVICSSAGILQFSIGFLLVFRSIVKFSIGSEALATYRGYLLSGVAVRNRCWSQRAYSFWTLNKRTRVRVNKGPC